MNESDSAGDGSPTAPGDAWEEGFEAGSTWEQSGPSGVSNDPPRNPYVDGAASAPPVGAEDTVSVGLARNPRFERLRSAAVAAPASSFSLDPISAENLPDSMWRIADSLASLSRSHSWSGAEEDILCNALNLLNAEANRITDKLAEAAKEAADRELAMQVIAEKTSYPGYRGDAPDWALDLAVAAIQAADNRAGRTEGDPK